MASPLDGETRLIRGTFIHTLTLGDLEILHDHLLILNDSGSITYFNRADSPRSVELLAGGAGSLTIIPDGSFVLPAFCDLHLHAPQFLYQGNGLDLPLMQWLDKYALKAEERLDADNVLAKKVYTRLARRLIEHGTGTVLLFGTIKEDTNLLLAQVMQDAGIRTFVGKLSMDLSSRPTYKESSADSALSSASSFVERCQHLVSHLPAHERRVEPVLTPRFVPTCSDTLLQGLGALSQSKSLRVQSHMAEAHDQITWVRSERGAEDVEIFDRSNLLTARTIQAHCTFLTQPELSLISARGTSVAHCPLSNTYFSTEPFPLREALQHGVKVGLGTDIAGGYSVDIMNAMRQAVCVSRMREGSRLRNEEGEQPEQGQSREALSIHWIESLYLATRGGALALGLPAGAGIFAVGASFDAQQIRIYDPETDAGVGPLDFFDSPPESGKFRLTKEIIEKWWCIGDTTNRVKVWVQGAKVSTIKMEYHLQV